MNSDVSIYPLEENNSNRIVVREELATNNTEKSKLKLYIANKEQYNIANNKVNSFIKPLYDNILKFRNFEKGGNELDILKIYRNTNLYDYISNFSNLELKKLATKINHFNKNELTLFIYTLHENLKKNPKNTPKIFLKDLIFRINKGVLKKGLLSNKFYQTCPETYKGFFRALQSGTLYTTKTDLIDGKMQRVYLKGSIGTKKGLVDKVGNTFSGYNRLLMDQNLNVYSFKTDAFGKITQVKPQIILDNIKVWSVQKYGSKKYVEKFKKSFIEYIDKAYAKGNIGGLERIHKTNQAFGLKNKKKKINNNHRK